MNPFGNEMKRNSEKRLHLKIFLSYVDYKLHTIHDNPVSQELVPHRFDFRYM
uniref:Uncharacterized protein n=1 Tax=Rhizophagus irregularis (strain DAOM 181602 / DAOM 197198 / MUCL 43194) TaxID=747089 RepID=U9TFQ4_RHIID